MREAKIAKETSFEMWKVVEGKGKQAAGKIFRCARVARLVVDRERAGVQLVAAFADRSFGFREFEVAR
jgi:hypothetical protein